MWTPELTLLEKIVRAATACFFLLPQHGGRQRTLLAGLGAGLHGED